MTLILSGALLMYDLDGTPVFEPIQGIVRLSTKSGGFVACAGMLFFHIHNANRYGNKLTLATSFATVGLKYAHIDVTHVLNVLALQLAMLGDAVLRHHHHSNLVLARYRLLFVFRAATVIFLLSLIVAQLVVVLSLDRLGWYEQLLFELVEFGWIVTMCYLLRLRDFRRFSARPVNGRRRANANAGDGAERDVAFEMQAGTQCAATLFSDWLTRDLAVEHEDVEMAPREALHVDSDSLDGHDGLMVVQLPPNLVDENDYLQPHIALASHGDIGTRLRERKARIASALNGL